MTRGNIIWKELIFFEYSFFVDDCPRGGRLKDLTLGFLLYEKPKKKFRICCQVLVTWFVEWGSNRKVQPWDGWQDSINGRKKERKKEKCGEDVEGFPTLRRGWNGVEAWLVLGGSKLQGLPRSPTPASVSHFQHSWTALHLLRTVRQALFACVVCPWVVGKCSFSGRSINAVCSIGVTFLGSYWLCWAFLGMAIPLFWGEMLQKKSKRGRSIEYS